MWHIVRGYVDRSEPWFVRDDLTSNLAIEAETSGDYAEALMWYEKLEAEGSHGTIKGSAKLHKIATLLRLGRTDAARRAVEAIPQHGVGGVRTAADAGDAFYRSQFLLALGDGAAARQSFLSQSPELDDAEARREYLSAALRLGAELNVRGEPAQALSFHRALVERYPDLSRNGTFGKKHMSPPPPPTAFKPCERSRRFWTDKVRRCTGPPKFGG